MELLKDRVIVVTGGAGLLGREFCKGIAEQGGISIMAEHNIEIAKKTINNLGVENIFSERININDKKNITQSIENIINKFGKIDGLVNSAYPRNKNYGKHFFNVEYDDFCDNVSMNLGGCFLTSQLFAKYFYNQGYGNILNIASIYGVVVPRFEIYKNTTMTMPVEYAAIKSALIHLTKYMAQYFKGKNIRVNTISLGGIENGHPQNFLDAYKKHTLNKGMLDPSDIVGTLIYLLSDLSTFVNGQNIIVDDGFVL